MSSVGDIGPALVLALREHRDTSKEFNGATEKLSHALADHATDEKTAFVQFANQFGRLKDHCIASVEQVTLESLSDGSQKSLGLQLIESVPHARARLKKAIDDHKAYKASKVSLQVYKEETYFKDMVEKSERLRTKLENELDGWKQDCRTGIQNVQLCLQLHYVPARNGVERTCFRVVVHPNCTVFNEEAPSALMAAQAQKRETNAQVNEETAPLVTAAEKNPMASEEEMETMNDASDSPQSGKKAGARETKDGFVLETHLNTNEPTGQETDPQGSTAPTKSSKGSDGDSKEPSMAQKLNVNKLASQFKSSSPCNAARNPQRDIDATPRIKNLGQNREEEQGEDMDVPGTPLGIPSDDGSGSFLDDSDSSYSLQVMLHVENDTHVKSSNEETSSDDDTTLCLGQQYGPSGKVAASNSPRNMEEEDAVSVESTDSPNLQISNSRIYSLLGPHVAAALEVPAPPATLGADDSVTLDHNSTSVSRQTDPTFYKETVQFAQAPYQVTKWGAKFNILPLKEGELINRRLGKRKMGDHDVLMKLNDDKEPSLIGRLLRVPAEVNGDESVLTDYTTDRTAKNQGMAMIPEHQETGEERRAIAEGTNEDGAPLLPCFALRKDPKCNEASYMPLKTASGVNVLRFYRQLKGGAIDPRFFFDRFQAKEKEPAGWPAIQKHQANRRKHYHENHGRVVPRPFQTEDTVEEARNNEVDIVEVLEENLLEMVRRIIPNSTIVVEKKTVFSVDPRDEDEVINEGTKYKCHVEFENKSEKNLELTDEKFPGPFQHTIDRAEKGLFYDSRNKALYSLLLWLVVRYADKSVTRQWFDCLFHFGQTYKILIVRDGAKAVGTIRRRWKKEKKGGNITKKDKVLPFSVGDDEQFLFAPSSFSKAEEEIFET